MQYLIDAANRRVGKKVNGVTTQRLLYSGDLKPVAEVDSAGRVVTRYVFATHENVPEYMVRGGVVYRFVLDHIGSVRLVVNSQTGGIVQRLDYDEFGNVLFDSNPGFQPFGYAGGLYDQQTKLVRFGARDYDATAGRWTAKDPVRFRGGDPNLYGYVLNDPVNRVDFWGLQCDCNDVPKAPPGVDISKNIEKAYYEIPKGLFYFYLRNKGPWNYKKLGSQYRDFGNFNYGATGAAIGFSERTLLRMAGWAQQQPGTSKTEWGYPGNLLNPWGGTPPYGDDPDDQEIISKGIRYYYDCYVKGIRK